MTVNKNATTSTWVDPDDAPEWTDEMFEMGQVSIGNVIVRPATGHLTKDGMKPFGRPSLGDAARKPVTMRLPPDVLDWFRKSGPGWQRRVSDILENYVAGRKAG